MTFDDYTAAARKTSRYGGTPLERLSYVSIAFGGEAGEYLNAYKKYLRGAPDRHNLPDGEIRTLMLLELGDALWYLSQVASELGSTLDIVASLNLAKLEARYQAIKGE